VALPIDLKSAVTAVGALGTAAFGLVDATKTFSRVNHIGFARISGTIRSLTSSSTQTGMSQSQIVATLESNWVNGADLGNQKSIAKSLIKMNLSAASAPQVAHQTGLNPAALTAVATKIAAGTALTGSEPDVLSRFDFAVTALLDETYQCADQTYRNATRGLAMGVAVLLGVVGAMVITNEPWPWQHVPKRDLLEGFIVGLLATPLAPIAKDLSSALATAVNAMQSVRKKP
jgi:hypothetical protein